MVLEAHVALNCVLELMAAVLIKCHKLMQIYNGTPGKKGHWQGKNGWLADKNRAFSVLMPRIFST